MIAVTNMSSDQGLQLRRSDALAQYFPIEDLHCYNLPFGALGFVSHVLTYYTIVCLWYGRKPLWPFKKLNNSKLDLVLGSVGVGLCIVMSLITIINCRNIWQLLLIAIWKLSMSLLSGLTALHVAIMVFNNPEHDLIKTHHSAWWIVLYVPGMLAGMIGLMNLVVKVADRTPDLLSLTIAFYCVVGAALVVTIVYSISVLWLGGGAPAKVLGTGCLITIASFVVLSAFYSDWALGIMLDSLLGTPSGDNSGLYWTYFVAKRLTLFSL